MENLIEKAKKKKMEKKMKEHNLKQPANEYLTRPSNKEMMALQSDETPFAVIKSRQHVQGHEHFEESLFIEKVKDSKAYWAEQTVYPGTLVSRFNIGNVRMQYAGKWKILDQVAGDEKFVGKSLGHRKVVMVLLKSDPVIELFLSTPSVLEVFGKQLKRFLAKCNFAAAFSPTPPNPEDEEKGICCGIFDACIGRHPRDYEYNYYMYVDSDESGHEMAKHVRKKKLDLKSIFLEGKEEDEEHLIKKKSREEVRILGEKERSIKPSECSKGHLFFTNCENGRNLFKKLRSQEVSDRQKAMSGIFRRVFLGFAALCGFVCLVIFFAMIFVSLVFLGMIGYGALGITGGCLVIAFLFCICCCSNLCCCLCLPYRIRRVNKYEHHRYALMFLPVGEEREEDEEEVDPDEVLEMSETKKKGFMMNALGEVYKDRFFALAKFRLLHEILHADTAPVFNYKSSFRLSKIGFFDLLKAWRESLKTPEYLISRLTQTPWKAGEEIEKRKEEYDAKVKENPDIDTRSETIVL